MADIGVRFFIDTIRNPAKSADAGRPIFDEREMVEVLIPGDKNFRPVFPAHDLAEMEDGKGRQSRTWAEKYFEAYREFRSGNDRSSSGTPLDELAWLSRARVSELRALGIDSVEQLASLSDRNRSRLGPDARDLMARAQAYIDAAADAATPAKLAAENAEMKDRLAQMEAMMLAMQAEAPKRGPGRPRKAVADEPADEEADAA